MSVSTSERLKKIIASCGDGVNIEEIHEDSDLGIDFGFNSVSIMQVIYEIETEFHIEIDNNDYLELDNLLKYKVLLRMIEQKLSS